MVKKNFIRFHNACLQLLEVENEYTDNLNAAERTNGGVQRGSWVKISGLESLNIPNQIQENTTATGKTVSEIMRALCHAKTTTSTQVIGKRFLKMQKKFTLCTYY